MPRQDFSRPQLAATLPGCLTEGTNVSNVYLLIIKLICRTKIINRTFYIKLYYSSIPAANSLMRYLIYVTHHMFTFSAVRAVSWGEGTSLFATASDPFHTRELGAISIFDFPSQDILSTRKIVTTKRTWNLFSMSAAKYCHEYLT